MLRRLAMGLLAMSLCTLTAFASNRVTNIDVEAVIQADGSMDITQTWTGTFTEGTENYIPMNLDSDMTLTNLQVTSQGQVFETVADWNINWDFEEKAYRCGINDAGGVFELCYGISEYGQQTYVLSYTLANVITGYSDYDAMNFRFVNDDMNTTPTAVTVEIALADGTQITDAVADIWGFGFDGTVVFQNGIVVAESDGNISSSDHVTVMLALEKGILNPTRTESGSFDTMKDLAMEDSDYDSGSSTQSVKSKMLSGLLNVVVLIQTFGMMILCFGFLGYCSWKRKKERKQLKRFEKEVDYFRDIPNGGDLDVTYALGRMFGACDEGAILGTRILRLIDQECLAPITEESVSFFGRTKEMVSLRLDGYQPHKIEELDAQLYDILEKAAGDDGVLQSKELDVFLKKNDRVLRSFINNCQTKGRVSLMHKSAFTNKGRKGTLDNLTPAGKEELSELLGFKRYLEDFTLIAERGVKELPLWKELLCYAMLFGLADKLAEQMAELYPDMAPEVRTYSRRMNTAYAYHYTLYSGMRRAENRRAQASRSSGGGGRSSGGGGGGSRGGGSGGGSR